MRRHLGRMLVTAFLLLICGAASAQPDLPRYGVPTPAGTLVLPMPTFDTGSFPNGGVRIVFNPPTGDFLIVNREGRIVGATKPEGAVQGVPIWRETLLPERYRPRSLDPPPPRPAEPATTQASGFSDPDVGARAMAEYDAGIAAAARCDRIGVQNALDYLDALLRSLQDTRRLLARINAPRAQLVRRDIERVTALRQRLADTPLNCPPEDRRTMLAPGFPGVPTLQPWFGAGFRWASADAEYASTGAQLPASASVSDSFGQACAGADLRRPLRPDGINAVLISLALCSGGEQALISVLRHGRGAVASQLRTRLLVDMLLLYQHVLPLGPNQVALALGGGPSFRLFEHQVTSDQSFFGGGTPSARESGWQGGFALAAGLTTALCEACLMNNPLLLGAQARLRFFPDSTVDVRSQAFGFIETVRARNAIEASLLITLTMPFVLGR